MTAIFTSAHLGFFDSSLNVLGQAGTAGNSALGNGSEQVYVNAATGNLLLQRQDEVLVGKGLDARLVRTYNSLGLLNDNNANNWRLNVEKSLRFTGSLNQPGSKIVRLGGDGSEITYHFVSQGIYRSKDGAGAHDSFVQSGTDWIWQDGNNGSKEIYDTSGQLTGIEDRDGNRTTYGYSGNKISNIQLPDGQQVVLNYAGNNLSSVTTISNSMVLNRVAYEYDDQNRLTHVHVDLSPEDSDTSDGNRYTTRYTYENLSHRIASITQSDGTTASFSYVQRQGEYLVKTVTDGAGNTTTYNYYNDDDGNGSWVRNVDVNGSYTEVVNPLGETTRFYYDGNGYLTRVESPAVNGQPLVTQFGYADGNLIWTIDASGSRTDYRYDSNGNQILSRDSVGNSVERFYDSGNRLLRETIYLQPDPDAIASGSNPSEPVSSYFVYDNEGHLRFSVNGEGEVSEQRYLASGELSEQWSFSNSAFSESLGDDNAASLITLESWLAGLSDLSTAQKTTFSYDFRGQLETTTSWSVLNAAGNGVGSASVTRMVYDQQGKLLKTVTPRGEATIDLDDFTTQYVYDGLGRLLQTIDAKGTVFTTQYDDAGATISTQNGLGLTTSSVFDTAGRLLNVTRRGNSNRLLGQTTFSYDNAGRLRATTDTDGNRNYQFYDAVGRVQYTVDAYGAVSESTYTANGQIETQRLYKNDVSSITWFDSNTQQVTLSTAEFEANFKPANHSEDRVTSRTYDDAGRLLSETDGIATSTYLYNGANQLLQVTVSGVDGERVSRFFYDDAGRQIGTLDAEGYLIRNEYDEAGQLTLQIRFAQVTGESLRATGAWSALLASVQTDADIQADNQTLSYYYNANGQVVGEVDAEGYLTENIYNLDGNITGITRYSLAVSVNTGDSLASIRPVADSQAQTTETQYDELGRIEAVIDPQGNAQWFEYDTAGNVRRVILGEQTQTGELRYRYNRYDEAGRLVGKLDTLSSMMLGESATNSEIDSHLQEYGTRSIYDDNGRLTHTIDALGRKTFFYYNERGQLVYTVNALGEATKSEYNSFGDVTKTRSFASRVSVTNLTGGDASSFNEPPMNNAKDSVIEYRFNSRGLVREVLQQIYRSNAVDNITSSTSYNTWGELKQTIAQKDFDGNRVTSLFEYDKRGLLTRSTSDLDGLNRAAITKFDAFGRAIEFTDANNQTLTREYDRLGRVIVTTDALNQQGSTTYDAFSRVATQTDRLGNTTGYQYDTANRRMTLTLADGSQTISVQNEFGETVEVINGKGQSTFYEFDVNGQSTKVIDALGNESRQTYDKLGRLEFSFDAEGRKVAVNYDSVNRIWQRIIDPDGLAIRTEYTYDAKGQTVQIKDPNGMVTETQYDKLGRATQVIVDLTGQRITTVYEHDAQGNQVKITEAANTTAARVTNYFYDNLGQLKSTQIDPDDQNIVTAFEYDNNGNMVKKTDALGQSEYYVYDQLNRLTYSIDKLGYVSENVYDSEGRVVESKRYEQAIHLDSGSPTQSDIEDALSYTWFEDFSGSSLVNTQLSAGGESSQGLFLDGGQLVFKRAEISASRWPSLLSNDDLRFDNNVNLSYELTMGENSGQGYYYGGLHNRGSWNNGQLFRHALTLSGGQLRATHIENSVTQETAVLGNVEAHNTYVVEYETSATTSTVFVYQKGQTKADAWTHTVTIDDSIWGDTRFQLYSNPRTTGDGSELYVDNVSLRPVDGQTSSLSTAKDAFESTQYHYDVNGRLKYSVDAEGYISENVYDRNGQLTETRRYDERIDNKSDFLSKAVSWQSVSNTLDTTGNSIELPSDASNGWSNGARSNETIRGEGFVEFSMPSLNKNIMVGLNHTDSTKSYTDLDFAFYHYSDNSIRIYEEGSHILKVTIPQKSGNRYRIEIENSVAKYYVREAGTFEFNLVHTSSRNVDNNRDYFVDTSLFRAEAMAQNVVIGDKALSTKTSSGTRYIYDSAGRQQFAINAEGYVSENVFDKSGNIIESIRYDLNVNASQENAAAIRLATSTLSDSQIHRTRYFYDAANRQRFVANAEGFITETIYDARGQILETKEYENLTIDELASSSSYNQPADASHWQVYDNTPAGATVSQIFDNVLGRNVTQLQGSGTSNGYRLWKNSANASWMNVDSTDIRWQMKYNEGFTVYISTQTTKGHRYFTYRNNNNDPVDNGSGYYFFGIGSDTTNGSWKTIERDLTSDLLNVDPDNEIIHVNAFLIRGSGLVGDVELINESSAEELAAKIEAASQTEQQHRTTYAVYDSVGRVRYNINALGEVTENKYNAASRVVETIAYASAVANIESVEKTESTITSLLNTSNARHSYFIYDSIGQVRYTINSTGHVTENNYDSNGRVTGTIQYHEAYSGNYNAATESDLLAYFSVNNSAFDRTTKTVYDALGNVLHSYDANNQFDSYSYDAFGNVTRFTNKKHDTWNYLYDKLGNLIEESTPSEDLYYSSASGNPVKVTDASVISLMQYDYMGNVISHTEGILDNGSTRVTAQSRTTEYRYDKLGHQIEVDYPNINSTDYSVYTSYDAFGNPVVNQDVAGNYSYRIYDALNREVYAVDAEGYVTAYTYDSFGNQQTITRFENAIAGFDSRNSQAYQEADLNTFVSNQTKYRVIEQFYDELGRIERTAQSEIDVYDPVTGETYRARPTSETEYNSFGEVIEERVLVENNSSEVWATTNHYYNELGQRVGSVDAQGYYTLSEYNDFGELARTTEYAIALDAWSKNTKPVNPATHHRANPNFDESLGADRIRSFDYDKLGRLTHEYTESHSYQTTVNSINVIGQGQGTTRHLMVTTDYDELNNVKKINQQGVITSKGYNKLGHALNVEKHARMSLADTNTSSLTTVSGQKAIAGSGEARSPYVSYKTDAFGNVLEERRFAQGKSASGTLLTSLDDIVNTFSFDLHGNKIQQVDAGGNVTQFSYDLAGNIIRESKDYQNAIKTQNYTAVTEFGYDRVGQQIYTEIFLSSDNQLAHSSVNNQVIAVVYNGYGETIARGDKKRIDGELKADYINRLQELFSYDAAGRMTSSSGVDSANGTAAADQVFKYNLQGLTTYEDIQGKGISKHHYDVKGQRTRSELQSIVQSFADDANPAVLTPDIRQEYDRWGNVTQVVDARGYVYNYVYNESDQLVKEIAPKTFLVNEDATEDSEFTPVTEYGYDIQGHQIFVKDAAGHVRQKVYDDVGQVIKEIDALGAETHYAFDVLGRQVAKENALGYITTQKFNRLNQVISQGDVRKANDGVFYNQEIARFEYNALGHQTKAGFAYGIDANNSQTLFAEKHTDYDVRGNVIRTETATGLTVTSHYDSKGRKDWERNGLWTSGSQHEHRWTFDYFGKALTYNNLGGTEFTFEYNDLGQLARKVRTAERTELNADGNFRWGVEYDYYDNGLLKSIRDKDTDSYSFYEYDENGQRTYVRTEGTDARSILFDNVTTTLYDESGRISSVENIDLLQNLVTMKATYVYDEVGNRRAVQVASEYDYNYVEPINTAPSANGTISDKTLDELDTTSFYLGQSLFSDVDSSRGDSLSFYALREYGYWDTVFDWNNGEPLDQEEWRSNGYNELESWMNLRVTSDNKFYMDVTQPPIGSSNIENESGDGAFRILIRAEDRSGASASLFFNLTVNPYQNKMPTASAISDQTVNEGESKSIDVADAFSDFEGDALTYFGKSVTPGYWDFQWNPNMNEPVPVWIPEQESGLPSWVSVSSSGVVQVTNAPVDASMDSTQLIRVYAKETSTAEEYQVSSDFNLTVLATNDAPEVDQGLPNSIHAEIGSTFNYVIPNNAFKDVNADVLSYSVSGLPNSVTFSPSSKSFGGTPSLADAGTYLITVTATDPSGLTATETFNLSVNGTPNANGSLPNKSYQATRNFTFHARTPFSDPNGDSLTYQAQLITQEWINGEPGVPGQWIVTYSPLPIWLNFDTTNSVFTGPAPSSAANETFAIRVRANDGMRTSAWTQFDLAITSYENQAPDAGNIPDQSISEGQLFNYQVPNDMFSDPDGHSLIYSAQYKTAGHWEDGLPIGPGEPGPPVWVEGSWVSLPSWLTFNATTRTFSGTRSGISLNETLQLRVLATESGVTPALSASSEFNLTIVAANDAPYLNRPPASSYIMQVGEAFSLDLPQDTFADSNNDVLTYSVLNKPSWMTFVASQLEFTATPTASHLGSHTITLRATDEHGLTADRDITFIVNSAPVENGLPLNKSTQAERYLNYNVASYFSDPDGQALTYSATQKVENSFYDAEMDRWMYWTTYPSLPSWLTMSSSGRLTGTPPANEANNSYTVRVTVTDGTSSIERDFDLSITPFSNIAPVVDTPLSDRSVQETKSLSYTFSSGSFSDADGHSLTYTARLSNGSALPSWISFNQSTRTFNFTPQYGQQGNHDIRVTASDGNGGSVSDVFRVTVTQGPNRAPTVNTQLQNKTVRENNSLNYTFASNSFVDPDGQTLTYSATLSNGSALPSWLSFNAANRTFTMNPNYGHKGTYDVTVTAKDSGNLSVADTFRVTVSQGDNRRPTAGTIPNQSTNEGQAFSYTVANNVFNDPDGNTLSFSANLMKFEFVQTGTDGEGFPIGEMQWVERSLPNWLSFNASSRTFSGTRTGISLSESLKLRVTATEQGTSQLYSVFSDFDLSVIPTNDAPTINVAPALSYVMQVGQSFTLDLPQNTFADANNDSMTYSVINKPSWMTFTASQLKFTATPNSSQVGSYAVTLRATDEHGAYVNRNITFIVNRVPIESGLPATKNTQAQRYLNYNVANYFSDPDGQSLTYTATQEVENSFYEPEFDQWIYWTSYEALPSWLTMSSTGRLTGTPPSGETNKSYDVRVKVSDGNQYIYRTFALNITPFQNIAPVVNLPIADQSVQETKSKSLTFASNTFTDADGHGLTYSAKQSNGSSLPSWLTFNASTRRFTMSPGYNHKGTYYIKVTANDNNGGTVSDTFKLTVTAGPNRSPYVNSAIPNQSAREGVLKEFTVSSVAFKDPDGNALTYSAKLLSGSSLPSWITFNTSTRKFVFNPNYGNKGTYDISVTARDPSGLQVTDTYRLTVTQGGNRAPVVSAGIPNRTAQETVYWNYTFPSNAFSDPDGNALTYQAQYLVPGRWIEGPDLAPGEPGEPIYIPPYWSNSLPSWLSFNSSSRRFTGTPPINYQASIQLRIIASDPSGLTANDAFTLTINNAPNRGPVVNSPIPDRSGNKNVYFNYTFPSSTFTDADGDSLSYSAKLTNGNSLPSWLSFNTSTRRFTGTPNTTGTYYIRVTATDGRGGSVYDDFKLTINAAANNPPVVVNPIPNINLERFDPVFLTVSSSAFSDPNGDTLTYSAKQSSGAALPSWLTFNASTRRFGGFARVVGSFYITVTASDGRGGSVSDTFRIRVNGGGGDIPFDPRRRQSVSLSSFASSSVQFSAKSIDVTKSDKQTLSVKDSRRLKSLEQQLARLDNSVKDDLSRYLDVVKERHDSFVSSDIDTLAKLIWDLRVAARSSDKSTFYDQLANLERFLGAEKRYESLVVEPSLAKSSLSQTMTSLSVDGPYFYEDYEPRDPRFDPDDLPTNVRQFKEYWYTYDAENRITVAEGYKKLNDDNTFSIDIKNGQGSIIKYDALGNQVLRVQQSGSTSYDVEKFIYNQQGQLVESKKVKRGVAINGSDMRNETQRDAFYNDADHWQTAIKKEYDLAGRVTAQRDYYLKDTYKTVRVEVDDRRWEDLTLDVYGALKSRQDTVYDLDGRATNISNWGITQTFWSGHSYYEFGRFDDYDFSNRINDSDLRRLSQVLYNTGAYDDAGRLTSYQYKKERKGEGDSEELSSYTYTYSYGYQAHDNYLQSSVVGTGSHDYQKDGYTNTYYDKNGRAEQVVERYREERITTQSRRYFRNNGDGQVIYKEWGEYDTDENELTIEAEDKRHFFYANGEQIGSVDGKGRILFDEQAGYNLVSASGMSNDGTYSVQQGDSLRSIARLMFGSESMWYVIADANGLTDDNVRLEVGQTLKIPAQDTNVNDANTFKAYNTEEIIGDRTPAIPYVEPPPRPDKGCGVIGTIIMIVVTVVVTIYTAGAATNAMLAAWGATAGAATAASVGAAMIGGFVGGFVGSVAGQVVGNALGVVDGFSLRQAVGSGLTSAFTAGLGDYLKGAEGFGWARDVAENGDTVLSSWGQVASAAIMVPVGVGLNKAVGLPASFKWSNVAMAGISAGISANTDISSQIDSESIGGMFADAGMSILRKGTGHIIRKALFKEGKWDTRSVVADAFGNAIGNSLNAIYDISGTAKKHGEALAEKLGWVETEARVTAPRLPERTVVTDNVSDEGLIVNPNSAKQTAPSSMLGSAASLAADSTPAETTAEEIEPVAVVAETVEPEIEPTIADEILIENATEVAVINNDAPVVDDGFVEGFAEGGIVYRQKLDSLFGYEDPTIEELNRYYDTIDALGVAAKSNPADIESRATFERSLMNVLRAGANSSDTFYSIEGFSDTSGNPFQVSADALFAYATGDLSVTATSTDVLSEILTISEYSKSMGQLNVDNIKSATYNNMTSVFTDILKIPGRLKNLFGDSFNLMEQLNNIDVTQGLNPANTEILETAIDLSIKAVDAGDRIVGKKIKAFKSIFERISRISSQRVDVNELVTESIAQVVLEQSGLFARVDSIQTIGEATTGKGANGLDLVALSHDGNTVYSFEVKASRGNRKLALSTGKNLKDGTYSPGQKAGANIFTRNRIARFTDPSNNRYYGRATPETREIARIYSDALTNGASIDGKVMYVKNMFSDDISKPQSVEFAPWRRTGR